MRIVGQTTTKRNAENYDERTENKNNQQIRPKNDANNNDQDVQIVYILPKHYQYYDLKSPIFDLTSIIQQQQSNDNLMIKSIIILHSK
ncbi:hypothetical protein BLA29_002108 [Euroglyphus maynei]|uniref:Uncharacterized protein n=1 Tax=Euroglyphus maynei TaxID=6958 RepID=A0A1Y3AYH5_EURMA|nr:hypothetical protein BLA29_002108 [Euroglyphus maynei]